MMGRFSHWVLASSVVFSVAAACGGGGSNGSQYVSPDASMGEGGVFEEGGIHFGDGGGLPDGEVAGFDVEPSAIQTISVTAGQTMPTVAYVATYNGVAAPAAWTIDRGDVASIGAGPGSMTTFTPTGTTGGLVNVIAGFMNQTVTRQVFVKIVEPAQNGANTSNPGEAGQIATSASQLGVGGGIGGVGGEGLGGAVTDPATLTALQTPTGDAGASGLTFLYPYDKTVWPRGMLAPLLMWSWASNDADAVQISLTTTSGSFSYTGTFSRPSLDAPPATFVRMPIPQDIWTTATNTAGGTTPSGTADDLTVSLTIAKSGVGYGPISETWHVAPALLTGTVYYNSYGTGYVQNWGGNVDTAGNRLGAAILGVRSGDLAPHLVVGENSTDDSGCRVCHIVASRGKWLISQSEQGNPGDGLSRLYDLSQANIDGSGVQIPQQGVFAWAAMTGDGSYALTNAVNPSSSNPAIAGSTSSFFQFSAAPQGATLTGLPSGVAAGYPAYAPDDKAVAYVDVTGNTGTVDGPIKTAAYDTTNQTFSNVQTVATPATGQRIGYPFFLPDDSALVFETEVRSSLTDSVMVTRNGARSEISWVTLGGTPVVTPLYALNGKTPGGAASYLPVLPNSHGIPGGADPQSSYDETGWDDTTLNYEPTVLPVVAGGYAWVVFTSRRAYGNQIDNTPWNSWPTNYNTKLLADAPTKKLWVAAINLNAPAGSDPSNPGFYLPAQEILAGNSRGFWVLDPCRSDGSSCATGDQCCNGYCEPGSGDAGLICSNAPPNNTCSAPQEHCTTAADCCESTNECVNGFCAIIPQ
jgi:hypothetical protein